jgi:hypothetical protein
VEEYEDIYADEFNISENNDIQNIKEKPRLMKKDP